MLKSISLIPFLLGSLTAACGEPSAVGSTNPVNFGFGGPENFPIDPFISQLRAADLDGDGATDLAVVNNSRSKITLLYNQTGKTNLPVANLLG